MTYEALLGKFAVANIASTSMDSPGLTASSGVPVELTRNASVMAMLPVSADASQGIPVRDAGFVAVSRNRRGMRTSAGVENGATAGGRESSPGSGLCITDGVIEIFADGESWQRMGELNASSSDPQRSTANPFVAEEKRSDPNTSLEGNSRIPA